MKLPVKKRSAFRKLVTELGATDWAADILIDDAECRELEPAVRASTGGKALSERERNALRRVVSEANGEAELAAAEAETEAERAGKEVP